MAVEIKFSTSPQLSRGFYEGFSSLGCDQGFIVYPGKDSFEIKHGIKGIPIYEVEMIARALSKK